MQHSELRKRCNITLIRSTLFFLILFLVLTSCAEEEEKSEENPQIAYVLSSISGSSQRAIYSYKLDPVSGLPSLIGNAAGLKLNPGTSINANNNGNFLFLRSSDGQVYPFSIKKDTSLLQSSVDATPTILATSGGYRYLSMELDSLNQFAFLIYYKDVDINTGGEYPIYIPYSIIEVYSVDSKTGSLSFKSVHGPLYGKLRQLEFSKYGKYIYGASHTYATGSFSSPPIGTLFTFEFDRVTGVFSTTDSVRFNGWVLNTSRPLTMDPTGKFLFVIESSGFCNSINPTPDPPVYSWHTQGSRVLTFLIDQSTGLLTDSGQTMNIAPEVFTWGTTHPGGEFVYFLATHDYGYSSSCGGPPARSPTGIYSYYVTRDTGELHNTGIDYGGGSSKSIQVEPNGKFLYHMTSSFLNIHNIDPATGSLEAIGTPLGGATEYSLPGTAYSYPLIFVGY